MKEALRQSLQNLRANKLRSVLTMFGILWGIVSIVVLSAVGEGFRRGNDQVLREFGQNMAIVWGGRTSLQAGGERAGRRIVLMLDDVRAVAAQATRVATLSPEIQRAGVSVKSRYNEAAVMVHGIEPPYQDIRTIELEYGRPLNWEDEAQARRVAIVGSDMADQLFGRRWPLGEVITINGLPYTVIARIRKKEQDSSYSGPDNNKIFVPFAAMRRDLPRTDAPPDAVSQMLVAPTEAAVAEMMRYIDHREGRMADVDWPLSRELRSIIGRRHGFDPDDREALFIWTTSLESIMFERVVIQMKNFFSMVGVVTLLLGGIGVMNIMLVAVRERTREIGVRKALGATTRAIERQFFLEGFFLTLLSGGLGMALALGLCSLVNLAPLPPRFAGMIVTWTTAFGALAALVLVGVVTATYPARRAAQLPPVEALRFEV